MKSFAATLVLLSAAAIGNANPLLRDRAACNADNCARAVTGTNAQPALTSRSADCQSFLAKTVQPAPVTVTSTTTNNIPVATVQATTTIFVGDKNKRDAAANGATTYSASNVPSYASACSGTARYSSACSCWGITGSTTTRPASTIVYTQTVTMPYTVTEPLATQTVTPGKRPACGSSVQGQGGCGCTYTVTCGAKYTNGRLIKRVTLVSEMECVNECDTYDNCFNVDYNRRTGVCNIYNRSETTKMVKDDDVYAFAGTCTAETSGPDCRRG